MDIHFETERLCIRPAAEADLRDLMALYTDPVVLKYNCITPVTEEKMLAEIEKGRHPYLLELKETGKIIGELDLSDDDLRYGVESRCIAYELSTAHTGHGYMTEALNAFLAYCFREFKLDILSARVFKENTKSLKLLERLGFRQEGTLRYAVRSAEGIVYDDCLFSMTKEEFSCLK